MSAERVIANTLRLAQADLEAAKLLHAGKNRYAIYHCEQAAEKVIKAVLTSEGVHANIKHLLDDMVKQVPDANPLKPLLKQVEHLAAYATTYPDHLHHLIRAPTLRDRRALAPAPRPSRRRLP